jgi:hypothetical protein
MLLGWLLTILGLVLAGLAFLSGSPGSPNVFLFFVACVASISGVIWVMNAAKRLGSISLKEPGRPLPKWVLLLDRIGRWWARQDRPKPFWQKHMDDLAEWAEPPVSMGGSNFMRRIPEKMIAVLALLVGGALFIAALGMFVVGPLFLSPDFLTVGVADPLGRAYAAVCLTTGNCRLPYLLAGTVLAVLVVTLALLMMHAGMSAVEVYDEPDEDEPDEYTLGDVVAAIEVLDQRIVRARADLVLAGVLPLSPEEKAELEPIEPAF